MNSSYKTTANRSQSLPTLITMPKSAPTWLFFSGATLLAFCSVLYELLLAKIIVDITGDSITWESMTIAFFLAGMGFRAYFGMHDKGIALLDRLIEAERSIILAALCSYPFIVGVELLYRVYFYDLGILREQSLIPPIVFVGLISQIFSLAIGWASGAEIVFFLSAASPEMVKPIKNRAAKVLAVYHLGAFLGTGFFVSLTLRGSDPTRAILGVALLNSGILILGLLWRKQFKSDSQSIQQEKISQLRTLQILSPIAVLFLVLAIATEPLTALKLKNRYFNQYSTSFDQQGLSVNHNPWWLKSTWDLLTQSPSIKRVRTPYQVIDRIDEPGQESLFINGRFQIDRMTADDYHSSLVIPAMALMGKVPERILILGGGDGVLAGTLAHLELKITQVDLVDIDEEVIKMAKEVPWIRSLNGDTLNQWAPLKVHVMDAIAFLREDMPWGYPSKQRQNGPFDLIYIDLTYPYEADSVRFYSLEFFRMIRKNLRSLGAVALGVPFDLQRSSQEVWVKQFLWTLSKAGFSEMTTYGFDASNFAVISNAPQVTSPLSSPFLAYFKNHQNQAKILGRLQKSFAPLQWTRWKLSDIPKSQADVFSLLNPGHGTIEDSFY